MPSAFTSIRYIGRRKKVRLQCGEGRGGVMDARTGVGSAKQFYPPVTPPGIKINIWQSVSTFILLKKMEAAISVCVCACVYTQTKKYSLKSFFPKILGAFCLFVFPTCAKTHCLRKPSVSDGAPGEETECSMTPAEFKHTGTMVFHLLFYDFLPLRVLEKKIFRIPQCMYKHIHNWI